MNVFLSLYILDDEGESSLLPFLLAADDEESAMDLSDAFIEAVETMADSDCTAQDRAEASREIDNLRPFISLLEDEEEIKMVAQTLRQHNPKFEEEIVGHVGSVFTVSVEEDSGFSAETARVLRNHMTCHSVLSSLSVELV